MHVNHSMFNIKTTLLLYEVKLKIIVRLQTAKCSLLFYYVTKWAAIKQREITIRMFAYLFIKSTSHKARTKQAEIHTNRPAKIHIVCIYMYV